MLNHPWGMTDAEPGRCLAPPPSRPAAGALTALLEELMRRATRASWWSRAIRLLGLHADPRYPALLRKMNLPAG
jgi:hypothetical protein